MQPTARGGRPLVAAVVLFVLAACTDAPDPLTVPVPDRNSEPTAASSPATATPTAVDAPPGVARVQGCEPRSLLPSAATTRCGATVVSAVFSRLVELDPDDGRALWGSGADRAVARRVASVDGRRWEIELKEGWEFHDGTPVTASSFVDAWNFAAYGPNAQPHAFLFDPIVGFTDVHCPQAGCEPAHEQMRGLRVIDELTLEITLSAADRLLPRRLGHVAFSPLPPDAFEDPDAWGEAPVGNGPFRMEGAWQHGERISLRAHEDYPGAPPAAEGVDLMLYEDGLTAWEELVAGRLDVVDAIPPLLRDRAREDLGRVVRHGDDVQHLVVPSRRSDLADTGLALALSKAIDREALIEGHLDGPARPARGLVPAVVSNEVDRCGHRCRFDPAEARRILDREGLPTGGLELWFDRDSSHEPWVRAIARQWREHLGLDDQQVRVRSLPHTRWVSHLQDQRVPGLYPMGWSMDVASPSEYLRELHAPGGLFNFDRYVGENVGVRLSQAGAADTEAEARRILYDLEQSLLEDMHHIPLWTLSHEAFHTRRIEDVELDGKGRVQLTELEVVDAEVADEE